MVKASYFYLRRVFAPILASFRAREDGGVELWITNDTADALVDRAAVTLATFAAMTFNFQLNVAEGFFSIVAFGDPEQKAFDYLRKLKTGNTATFFAGESPLELTDDQLYDGILSSWRP